MNETRTRGGPNLGLLLLIPAVVIVAKAATHHRAMGPRGSHLPPRIETALDAWHARAHEASEPETSEPRPNEV